MGEEDKTDEQRTRELAQRARDAWNDDECIALREQHVNPNVDSQIIAWAYAWGILP